MDAIQMQEILLQLQTQQATIEQLQNQVAQQPPPPPPPAQVVPVPPAHITFPDPGKFDGKNTWTFPQWRQKIVAKLRADRDRIGDNQQQAWYIFSQLDSPASDRASPWMQQQQDAMTPLSLLLYLDNYYLDPTHQEKSCQKLFNVRQNKQQLPTFLTYFDQLLLESGGAQWAEQTKISLLRKAVDGNLLMFLVSRPTPTTYDELKRALRDIDNNAQLMQQTGPVQFFNQPRYGMAAQNVEPMDLDSVSSATKQRASWVSPEEIRRRRSANLCLRCSALGHQIKSCPYLPARRPASASLHVVDTEQNESLKE